ncbi:hypothetical protein DUNSADRAFT_13608 [Dunaliella salina]|uniref:Uncharacterized protein n=1 Tax=Dunaliella salina TaxID=3046 RepID=A0ABQ7G915_DUNSA|nr:hypothetical protein DUNSADRAFT_13608 [Dunaliella salina]|eukprot:KAF5831101.1 hypothetical protein DUNSADRAFT_13608 [Dunaliella salina]
MKEGQGQSAGPAIHGCVVLTRSSAQPLWQAFPSRPPGPKVPTKQLCSSIADVHRAEGAQDSSYMDAGTFVVASSAEAEYIVALVCTPASPETEVLLKAREISHSIRLLFGPVIKELAALEPQEFSRRTAGRNLLHFLLESLLARTSSDSSEFHAQLAARWLSAHASNDTLHAFFVAKLQQQQPSKDQQQSLGQQGQGANAVPPCGLSPCASAFAMLRSCSTLVCTHFVDLKEPGQDSVWIDHRLLHLAGAVALSLHPKEKRRATNRVSWESALQHCRSYGLWSGGKAIQCMLPLLWVPTQHQACRQLTYLERPRYIV